MYITLRMKYDTERLLNTAEAARFLRVSQASIRRWSDSGRLAASRIGGRRERRFKQSDLVAFMDREHSLTAAGPTVGGVPVPVPSHLAPFYSTDAGRLRLTVPFLAEGLRLGQPCVIVATEPLLTLYREALSGQDGVDLRQAESNGLFGTIRLGGNTTAGVIDDWERRFSELVARGASVIRLVGEMARVRTMFLSEDEMLRYEESFELMSRRYPVVAVCQYDVREFNGVAMLRALKAHPDMFEFRIGTFLN